MGRLFTYPWEIREGPLGGSPYSLEEMIAINPDILFVLSYNNADPNGPPLSEVLAQNPLWGQLKAVQNGAVHEVNTDLWGNGRGTRSLGATAEEALELAGAAR
ncbi:MAG: ABC transporter substrate-binding protein [Pseudonocardia sp.]